MEVFERLVYPTLLVVRRLIHIQTLATISCLSRCEDCIQLQNTILPKYMFNQFDSIVSDTFLTKLIKVSNSGIIACVTKISPHVTISLGHIPVRVSQPLGMICTYGISGYHNTLVVANTSHDNETWRCHISIHQLINCLVEGDFLLKQQLLHKNPNLNDIWFECVLKVVKNLLI